jgi:outer membrane protein assembly factor BamA
MKGALFLDAGNIWSIKEDDYDNSGFGNDFIKEIAIGTGFGIRYDVNFVVFRIDLATKLKNPYLGENNSRWVKDPIKNAINGNVVLNLGIGYPF